MLLNLKQLRIDSNLTQEDLAKHIGVSQQTINNYENHDIEPNINTLKNISNFFNVPIDYIVNNSISDTNLINSLILTSKEKVLLSKFKTLDFSLQEDVLEIISKLN